MTPSSPTATNRPSAKTTDLRLFVSGLTSEVQFRPSGEVRILPVAPTTTASTSVPAPGRHVLHQSFGLPALPIHRHGQLPLLGHRHEIASRPFDGHEVGGQRRLVAAPDDSILRELCSRRSAKVPTNLPAPATISTKASPPPGVQVIPSAESSEFSALFGLAEPTTHPAPLPTMVG